MNSKMTIEEIVSTASNPEEHIRISLHEDADSAEHDSSAEPDCVEYEGSSPTLSNSAFSDSPHTASGGTRRTRTILSPYQSRVLKRVLDQTLFPSTELRNSLASMLGIKPRTIQIWFQNQRQKAKLRQTPSSPSSNTDHITSVGLPPTNNNAANHSIRPNLLPSNDVRWVQFHGGIRNAASPASVMHSPIMAIAQNIPILQANAASNYTHISYNNVSSPTNPNDPTDHPRGGLDILASIASITTETAIQSKHHHSPLKSMNLPPISAIENLKQRPSQISILPSIEGKIAIKPYKRQEN